MIKIKGSILRSRLAFIEDQAGVEGTERVLSRLSAEDQESLRRVLATTWYPFELGARLDEAIAAVLGDGKLEYFETLGAASALQNLSGVHRDFLVPGDPQAFLSRASMIYSFYYDTGRREYRATGPKDGVLTTYDAETFHPADCLTVVGWYRKALEMCGAKNARGSSSRIAVAKAPPSAAITWPGSSARTGTPPPGGWQASQRQRRKLGSGPPRTRSLGP